LGCALIFPELWRSTRSNHFSLQSSQYFSHPKSANGTDVLGQNWAYVASSWQLTESRQHMRVCGHTLVWSDGGKRLESNELFIYCFRPTSTSPLSLFLVHIQIPRPIGIRN
jgi:hypothetical protein